ncbi:hypothetical protein AAF712_001697 [Marasmius tenuissimus]|uniref:Uncharacterized protein n=1 Tax=Marasmius tenuissimus TaxID=585030 RepID=A0ABR3AC41_9AGAR
MPSDTRQSKASDNYALNQIEKILLPDLRKLSLSDASLQGLGATTQVVASGLPSTPQTPAPLPPRISPLPSTVSPMDGPPSSMIHNETPALLTPFDHSSASPSPIRIIPISIAIPSARRNAKSIHHTLDSVEGSSTSPSGETTSPTSPVVVKYYPHTLHPLKNFNATAQVEYPKRSLFVIPESTVQAPAVDRTETPEVDDSRRRAHARNVPLTIHISPPPAPHQRVFKARDRPGLLKNLPEFSIPTTPPIGQSPPVYTPSPHQRVCSPLKSPFYIRRKEKEDVGYFVRVSG